MDFAVNSNSINFNDIKNARNYKKNDFNFSYNSQYNDMDYSNISTYTENINQTNNEVETPESNKFIENNIFYFGTSYLAEKTVTGALVTGAIKVSSIELSGGDASFKDFAGGTLKPLAKNYIVPELLTRARNDINIIKDTKVFNYVAERSTRIVQKMAQISKKNITQKGTARISELVIKAKSNSTNASKFTQKFNEIRNNQKIVNYNIKTQKNFSLSETTHGKVKNGRLISKTITATGVTYSQFLSAIGVDYAASVITNICVSKFVEGKSWKQALTSDAKYGSSLLKSSWKTACGIAFEKLFTVAGPAGQKFGRALGTVVGNEIGTFCSDVLFEGDESWCAAAGVATAIGATAGGVIVTACIAGGVIAASVPVAGWIVGGAIIVGAAVGTVIVWLAKLISGG